MIILQEKGMEVWEAQTNKNIITPYGKLQLFIRRIFYTLNIKGGANNIDTVLNNNLDLLKYALSHGMIDVSYMQEQVKMNKRNEILNKHPYSIWESKDGKWHTYLPDKKKGRVPRKRNSQKEIEDLVIEYWKTQEELPKTFDDAYHLWRKSHDVTLSNNSIVKYNTDYNRFFKENTFNKKEVEKITEEDIKTFIILTVKEQKLGKKACKTLFGYVKNTLYSAKVNKLIAENPIENLEAKQFYKYCTERNRPKEKTVVSDSDMAELYRRITEDYKEHPFYIPTYALHMAILTGMRVGELSALRWDSITKEHIVIDKSEKYDRVNKEYYIDTTKNGKERIFPITEEIQSLLDKIKNVEIKAGYICEWVFANESGRIHAPVISSCSKTKCRQLGITEKGIHAYRRTFNSKMKCAGVPTVIAASLLGHTEQVNEKYYTFDIEDIKNKATIVAHLNKEMISNC